MNWVPLRKNNIPLVDMQVNKVVNMHRQLQQSIQSGDILSVQAISQLELSIKRRIKQMDDFYDSNCMDTRVRFMQGARMRLARLLNRGPIQEKQTVVELPWKLSNPTNKMASSRESATPVKIKTRLESALRQNAVNPKQSSRSPIGNRKSPLVKQNPDNPQRIQPGIKKPNLRLDTPQEYDFQIPTFKQPDKIQPEHRQIKTSQTQRSNKTKSSRKHEYIPTKNTKANPNYCAKPVTHHIDRGKLHNVSQGYDKSPSGRTNTQDEYKTSKQRTLTENNPNCSSIKKLNDLIFTIKMTKQQYDDFMEIKKKLNNR